MSDICQCTKSDGFRCTRAVSKKSNANTSYCWQHQKCSQPYKNSKGIIPTETKMVKPLSSSIPFSVPSPSNSNGIIPPETYMVDTSSSPIYQGPATPFNIPSPITLTPRPIDYRKRLYNKTYGKSK